MREGLVEKHLRTQVEKLGGMCLKFVSPGNSGVPDRVVLLDGRAIFVELKAPGKKPRALQVYTHNKFADHGFPVVVIDTLEGVDRFICGLERKQENF